MQYCKRPNLTVLRATPGTLEHRRRLCVQCRCDGPEQQGLNNYILSGPLLYSPNIVMNTSCCSLCTTWALCNISSTPSTRLPEERLNMYFLAVIHGPCNSAVTSRKCSQISVHKRVLTSPCNMQKPAGKDHCMFSNFVHQLSDMHPEFASIAINPFA